jgi:uncharacterized protein (TIGR01244 family)
MPASDIFNFVQIDARTATSGQPTKAQFEAIAAEGYESVINIAPYLPDNGTMADEAEALAALGLSYRHIPVMWKSPAANDFELFNAAMESLQGNKLLIHCVANLRVTAFYSLYAMKRLGWTEQQADSLMNPLWNARPEYAEGGVWKSFVDAQRKDILSERQRPAD